MPRYLIEYGAGHRIAVLARNLAEAKMRLCKYLGVDWKDREAGARTMKLVETIEKDVS